MSDTPRPRIRQFGPRDFICFLPGSVIDICGKGETAEEAYGDWLAQLQEVEEEVA